MRASYKNLFVYKNSYKLSLIIHKLTIKLPFEARDLADQLRRCSRSIPTNIAEGYARNKSVKDKINFLRNSLGSNDEVLIHLSFLNDLNLYDRIIIRKLIEAYTINGKRINRLIAYNKSLINNS